MKNDTLGATIKIVADLLEIDQSSLSLSSVSEDFDEWDSFGVIKIGLYLEKNYNIELLDSILEKLNSIIGIISLLEADK